MSYDDPRDVRQVSIIADSGNNDQTLLPNGQTYDEGDTALLTDVEFAQIPDAKIGTVVADEGFVIGAPVSVEIGDTDPDVVLVGAAPGGAATDSIKINIGGTLYRLAVYADA